MYNQNLKKIKTFDQADKIIRIKTLLNGFVATTSSNNLVKIWNPLDNTNWTLVQTYTGHSAPVWAIEYIDKDTLVSGSQDYSIQIWSISTGATIRKIRTENYCFGYSAFSLKLLSNGIYLASGLFDGRIKIWNIQDGSLVSIINGPWVNTTIGNGVNDLVLIDNQTLAASFADGFVRIFDLTTNTLKFRLSVSRSGGVFGLKVISSGILATGSYDKNVKLWNATNGNQIGLLFSHTNSIFFSVDLLSDQILVSGSYDRKFKLWNLTTNKIYNSITTDLQINALAILNQTTISTYLEIHN